MVTHTLLNVLAPLPTPALGSAVHDIPDMLVCHLGRLQAARAPPTVRIEFLYDIVSPYSALAWQVLNRYRASWPTVDILPVPFLLGGVMKASGNQVRARVDRAAAIGRRHQPSARHTVS